MKFPTLTPLEALNRLRENNHEEFEHEGFCYYSDGPQMSPPEAWFPVAIEKGKDDDSFFPTGEECDPIDSNTTWFKA